jgi:hypothetical protein
VDLIAQKPLMELATTLIFSKFASLSDLLKNRRFNDKNEYSNAGSFTLSF